MEAQHLEIGPRVWVSKESIEASEGSPGAFIETAAFEKGLREPYPADVRRRVEDSHQAFIGSHVRGEGLPFPKMSKRNEEIRAAYIREELPEAENRRRRDEREANRASTHYWDPYGEG